MKSFLYKLNTFLLSKDFIRCLVVFGIILYLRQYLDNRSLWINEATVSLNIIKLPFCAFLHQPMPPYQQAAPFGFLAVEKICTHWAGTSEYVLRLFPLLSAISSIWLFRKMATLYLNNAFATLALFTFIFSPSLVYYASEVKPYSIDLFLTLVAYVFIIPSLLNSPDLGKTITIGLLGAVMIWFSFPILFVLSGIGITALLAGVIQKDWVKISKLGGIFLCWFISAISCYAVLMKNIAQIKSSESYWQNGYISFVNWKSLFIVFDNILHDPLEIWGCAFLAGAIFIIGAYSYFIKDKNKFFFLLSPLFLALLASSLHLYSCKTRLALFLIPIFLIMIVKGIETLSFKTGDCKTATSFSLTVLLFCFPILSVCTNLIHPEHKEEIKTVLSYIKEHIKPDDTLYIYSGAIPAFEYYKSRFNFSSDHSLIEDGEMFSDQNIVNRIERLDRSKRVWIIITHPWPSRSNEPHFIVNSLLKSGGRLLDTVSSNGAWGYLFDLSKLPIAAG